MKKHPQAGKPVKVTNGPYKDKYFIVIDYLVNQYQGKRIEKIKKAYPNLVGPVEKRIGGLDDEIVFGKLHPSMEFICMHDTELQVGREQSRHIEVDYPDNVVSINKGVSNDSGRTDQGSSDPISPGQPGPEGHSVPSGEVPKEDVGGVEVKGQADSPIGGGEGGTSQEHSGPSKPKPSNGSKGSGRNKKS